MDSLAARTRAQPPPSPRGGDALAAPGGGASARGGGDALADRPESGALHYTCQWDDSASEYGEIHVFKLSYYFEVRVFTSTTYCWLLPRRCTTTSTARCS